MDILQFITQRLSETALKEFLSQHGSDYVINLDYIIKKLVKVQVYMKGSNFQEHPQDKKQALIEGLRITVIKLAGFMSKFPIEQEHSPIYQDGDADEPNNQLFMEWMDVLNFFGGIIMLYDMLKINQTDNTFGLEKFGDVDFSNMDSVIRNIVCSSILDPVMLDDNQSIKVFLLKAFPILRDHHESFNKKTFFWELSRELDVLPLTICSACHRLGLPLVLIGSLLSLKPKIYDIWKKVKDDLCKFIDSKDRLVNIIRYCYDDLPYFLKPCFLYLACYPENYEIQARALIHIWTAEGFVSTDEGCTLEETAYNYLEQLVQRSLIQVTRRSFLGTIKYCCVNPLLHKFASDQSKKEGFLVANPDEKSSESLFRMAIHGDNKEWRHRELNNNHLHSFLAFDFQGNILSKAKYLEVLELKRSTVHDTVLQNMTFLRYLGLRYTNISALPESIDAMQQLQTLDLRNTVVESLPESLWKISELRNVYTDPNPGLKGPPTTTKSSALQILKTVAVPESWIKDIPRFLISVRKLGLCNPGSLDCRSISSVLRHLVNLHSLRIISNRLSSEFVDTRAFPYLQTVKSIFLEGQWYSRNLFLDNVNFPPNLTKLTLVESGLKEDPMLVLGKLKALRFLSLQKGAYMGKRMTCSAEGFPQLLHLELIELEHLIEWVVEETAMQKLETARVIRCTKLTNLPQLHVNIQREPQQSEHA